MKKSFIKIISVMAVLLGTSTVHAEGTEFAYSLGTDVVSSYVFRGTNCSLGPAIQPGVEFEYGSFAFGTWASADVDGVSAASELDLYLTYSVGGFSVGVTHYYYFGDTEFFGSATQTEAMVSYTFSDDVPLSLSWHTMIGGSEVGIVEADKRPFSTYIELAYSQSLPCDLGVTYTVGMSPWSGVYGEDFTVPNLSIRLDHELSLGEHCTMGTFLQPVYNTYTSNFACVLGCGFWF